MFRRTAHLLLLVAALASVTGIAAGQARADDVPYPFFFDFCKTAAPHATLNLGAGVPSVQATSAGGTYGVGLCPRFVVDIFVPPNSSGGYGYYNSFTVGGGYADLATGSPWGGLPLSQIECANYSGYLRVYRKSAILGGDFTVLGGGTTHGVWVPGGDVFGPYCAIVTAPGYVDLPVFNPPYLFGVVYRVTVGAKVGSSWRQVNAGAWHPPIIR
jgi:hypothetical protein